MPLIELRYISSIAQERQNARKRKNERNCCVKTPLSFADFRYVPIVYVWCGYFYRKTCSQRTYRVLFQFRKLLDL